MNFREFQRTWIVAEIGVNHEGDAAMAADLIDMAASAGADAVKFQTFQIEHYISTVQPDRRARTARFQLSQGEFRRLRDLAGNKGITFFSTPFDTRDVDFLDGLVPIFKVSSGDLTHLNLVRHVATKGKPVILSTGLGTPAEIAAAVAAVEEGQPGAGERGNLMLMHCVAAYPAPAGEANLRNIGWMAEEFGLPVGYSDHTLGTEACVLAVAAGAMALEKHFTYRKEDQAFHDHAISADPTDMGALVSAVRSAETYLGSQTRSRGVAEERNLVNMRRSLGAATNIPAGEPIREEWITYLRPAQGIGPEHFSRIIGRRLTRAVAAGDLIHPEDLDRP